MCGKGRVGGWPMALALRLVHDGFVCLDGWAGNQGVTGAWFRDLLICTFARAGQLGAGLWLLHLIYKGKAHSWCCWEATTF
jgi:hypothetical protein